MASSDESPRGIDRKPTREELSLPPDQRPWTVYDMNGDKQKKPHLKAMRCGPCLCMGPTCLVFELEWCKAEDADRTCDLLCRCQGHRLKTCLFCGPQCDEPLMPICCSCKSAEANAKISVAEFCEFDCFDSYCCSPRYAGCQLGCCHCTCVRCMPCCVGFCCFAEFYSAECCEYDYMSCCVGLCYLGGEEQLMMDGDLKPLTMHMQRDPMAV